MRLHPIERLAALAPDWRNPDYVTHTMVDLTRARVFPGDATSSSRFSSMVGSPSDVIWQGRSQMIKHWYCFVACMKFPHLA